MFIDVSRDALAKAQGAWYRMEKTAMKNHRFDINTNSIIIIDTFMISFVDQVDYD